MPRPKLGADARIHAVATKLTAEERQLLEDAAEREGVSVSAALREAGVEWAKATLSTNRLARTSRE